MRGDGDLLLQHVAAARSRVLLCAPFIKAAVLSRLFSAAREGITIDVVTRWLPKEVAAGVSDLETFDLVAARPGASLRLLNRLHAKLYLADNAMLAGSANMTATALGWCDNPNVELLMQVPADAEAVTRCLAELEHARPATAEERDAIRAKAQAMPPLKLPGSEETDEHLAQPWLPRSGAPARLYQVYRERGIDRLTRAAVEAARHDLDALGLPPGLGETEFNRAVAGRFASMPGMRDVMTGVAVDLTDEDAVQVLQGVVTADGMPPETQWLIIREWFTHFMPDTIEVAPQSYIVRPRPGSLI